MSKLQRILDMMAKGLMAAGGIAITAMMVQITMNVALRYLFNSYVPGTFVIVGSYYMVAVTFLPLAFVQAIRGHVIIELFTAKLPKRGVAAIDGVVYLLCGAAVLAFCYASSFKAIEMTEASEYAIGSITVVVWPSRWFVVAGTFAMGIYMLFHGAVEILFAAGHDDHADRRTMRIEESERI